MWKSLFIGVGIADFLGESGGAKWLGRKARELGAVVTAFKNDETAQIDKYTGMSDGNMAFASNANPKAGRLHMTTCRPAGQFKLHSSSPRIEP